MALPGNLTSPYNNLRVPTKSIGGKVTDNAGKPLAFVSVKVKGTTRGTATNADGVFNIDANKGDILEFSLIGYVATNVTVGDNTSINITMKPESAGLSEVVVVGYGSQKKVNLTGAVAQVTAKEIEGRPVANVGQALQGVIPNLNVTISNGSPNTTPSLNVRGGTSFTKSGTDFVIQTGSPFTLVDNIPMDISQVNPEDIESISLLKDAASSAIYGARAAYGVLLVTTKKGKKTEKPSISYYNDFQWNKPAAIPDLLNAYEIQDALIKAQALQNASASTDMITKLAAIKAYMDNPKTASPYIMSVPGNDASSIIWVANQNPYNEAVKASSPMQKHNLSLSGGSEKNTYYASLGYLDQDGIYKLNTDKFKRYNATFNLSSQVTNWFKLDFRTNYYNTTYTQPVNPSGKGGWWRALSQEPDRNVNMPMHAPANAPNNMGGRYTDNILSFMDYGSLDRQNTENLLLGVSPSIKLAKNWNIKSDIAYTSNSYSEKRIIPELNRIETSWYSTTNVYTSPSSVYKISDHFNQYLVNVYTDYSYSLKNHNFYALAGLNQEWYKDNYLDATGNSMITPSVPVITQTTGQRTANDAESEWAVRGAFYRFTYNYKGKYLLESNGRYDQTSRFPEDSRSKFFPSVSAGWRVSEEKFASIIKPVVTDLKLRASYGSIGNQNVANYIYVPSYGTTSQVTQLFNGTRPVGITPPGLVDPNITWETASTLDFGVDATLINKLDMQFDWYNRTTKDILVDGSKYPAVLGTNPPTQNSGELQTKGWELSLKWRDAASNGFRYDVAFGLSNYQTTVTKFNGNPNKLLSTLYAGQKMGEIWGYTTEGIFQSNDEIAKAPSQKQIYSGLLYPGDVRYANLDGDTIVSQGSNTVSDPGDRRIIGNSTPRFQFGLNSNFSWKNFDLNIFFQGVGKREVWVGDNLFWGAIAGGIGTRQVYSDSWTPDNTDAFYPAYKAASQNIQVQTRYLQNAAYIRLKNFTLGYSVPMKTIRHIGLQKVRVYAAGYNVWQYSKVPNVFDPEVLSANYPMMKSFAFGLQVTF
ncbi:SusC/RagA family TonB-linked outer membrane protein [Pinibacter soli]|uniref:TonB-dependent receptor n=1 Tax=Pinibacter soli TaxID=3044211 RepID=A0ABT6RFG1_9BACT|nr:TonB-dependent receptor [Pinibacter soli]MDI3321289.1 TonB-dependent receptor [Pinibacter soli]